MSRMIGVDVGGTFTDVFVLDEATGTAEVAKVPTTRPDQSGGFSTGSRGRSTTCRRSMSWSTAPPRAPTRCWSARARGSGSSPPRAARRAGDAPPRPAPDLGPARRFRTRGAARPAPRGARAHAGRWHDPRPSISTRCAPPRDLLDAGCAAVAILFANAYANPENEARAVAAVRALWPNPCQLFVRDPARDPRVRALLHHRAQRLSAARGLGLYRPAGRALTRAGSAGSS
jgi:N-methylhydantoinase A